MTHIGKTASALTDSFITMMQFISIGTFIIFAVLSLIVSWLVGSRLSKRVAKISKQVEALKPGDLDARIAPDGSDDEIGKLIESINGMLDRLQNATEAERRFVSNASHELRTPIAAVATNLDAPLSQGRFPADVEPAIRRALAANRRGSDLVQALLTPRASRAASSTPRTSPPCSSPISSTTSWPRWRSRPTSATSSSPRAMSQATCRSRPANR